MFELGKRQTLKMVKRVEFGAYLGEQENAEDRVLLPIRQVPEGLEHGDAIEVFLYKDSKDRLIATTSRPLLQIGEIARLKVAETGKIGAFLDWGLEKDLLLPFKEQTAKVGEGDEVLVSLYEDKSSRLCATMKIYEYLSKQTPYTIGDTVEGTVYELSDRFGAFVAVDDHYSALIPAKECFGEFHVGDRVSARVTAVKEDGKMDLSVRQKAYLQMDADVEAVLKVMESYGGKLPFNDKVSPEVIKKEFHLSKNAFKRAVGRLLKAGKVEITDNGILLK